MPTISISVLRRSLLNNWRAVTTSLRPLIVGVIKLVALVVGKGVAYSTLLRSSCSCEI
jgi:hypothetical protein